MDDDTSIYEPANPPAPERGADRTGVSRTTLVVSVIVAMLVAGLAGVLIGWKVEQQRVKDDLANIRPIGTVTSVSDDSVTIDLETASGSKTYEITDRTSVEGTGDVEEGATIFIRSWRRGEDGQLQVNKIVVLDGEGTEEPADE